jgi:hypothetical protein
MHGLKLLTLAAVAGTCFTAAAPEAEAQVAREYDVEISRSRARWASGAHIP